MSTAKTKSDALGYYQSIPAGLGGERSDLPANPLDPVISSPIGPVVVEHVTPSCGEGDATIEATSTTALKFKAPGDTFGTAVTVPANSSVLLESGTATKAVRVYRDSVYSANDLGGSMTLSLVSGMNNAVGGANDDQTGGYHNACIYLHNHSDDTISNISISSSSISGVTILLAIEEPVNGAVQTIADAYTGPVGLSYASTATISTLAPGESRALWINRLVAAATTVNPAALTTVTVAFDYGGVTYTDPLEGYFRIADASLALYELHVNQGAAPAFTSATTTSATLPFTSALSVSNTHYYACRQRNQYNLESFNVLTEKTVTGSGGEDETETITDPTVNEIDAYSGGEVDITLNYQAALDSTPADTWRLYITTDGTTPDPASDTPADTTMMVSGLARTSLTNRITLGPYAYGTVVNVVPRVYSSTLDAESGNTTASSVTVDTQVPIGVNKMGVTSGSYRAVQRPVLDSTTYYNDPTNTVGIRTRDNETELFGNSTAFRGLLGNNSELWTALDFSNVAHSTSGTATPIEVTDANTFYINVNGTRRAKIDLSSGIIEAATFEFEETLLSVPVIGPTYTTSTETFLQIKNGHTGRWTPVVKVDSSGVFTSTLAIQQD